MVAALTPQWWQPLPPCSSPSVSITPVQPGIAVPVRRHVLRNGRDDLRATLAADADPTTLHLAALATGTSIVLGTLTLIAQPWPEVNSPSQVRLALMAVFPQFQRKGIGGLLLAAAQAATAGVESGLWATARDTALDFYKRAGFVVVGSGFTGAMELPHHHILWLPGVAAAGA